MNDYHLDDVVDLAILAAMPNGPSGELTHEHAARYLVGLLSGQEEEMVLTNVTAFSDCADVLSDCARELEHLQGKASADLRSAALEGGCRGAVAGVLLDVRSLRTSAEAEGRLTLTGLLESLRASLMTRGQVRAVLASRDVPPLRAVTRDGRRVAVHHVDGSKVTIDVAQSTGRGWLCIYPSMVKLAEIGPDSASFEFDFDEFPELAQILSSEDSGFRLVITED
jgi:hypothetical protein